MRLRPAFAALSATALLGLAACGGSDDSTAGSGSSSAGTSSAASSSSAESGGSGDAEAQAFCTESETALAELGNQLEAATPEQLPTLLPQLVSTLDTLEPPAAITTPFQTLRDAYDQLAQVAADDDLTTPEGQTAFQQAASDLGTTAQPAEDEITTWTDANCASSSASPTSWVSSRG